MRRPNKLPPWERKSPRRRRKGFTDTSQLGNRLGWMAIIGGGGLFLIYVLVAALNRS